MNAFVDHYNKTCATSYVLTRCLDVEKAAEPPAKQPEVLLTDAQTRHRMVVERKSVVVPEDYIYRHSLEHEFADRFWQETRGLFQDDGYALSIAVQNLQGMTSPMVSLVARDIGSTVATLTPADLPVMRRTPIRWCFRKLFPGEDEDDLRGIVVQQFFPTGILAPDEALAVLPRRLQAVLDASAKKFLGYTSETKLVLLDFYSGQLMEDDVPPAFAAIRIPPIIDEVWKTARSWISMDDFHVEYERLFLRSQ